MVEVANLLKEQHKNTQGPKSQTQPESSEEEGSQSSSKKVET